MSSAPDTPNTPPQKLPAKRGEVWNRKPSHSTNSRATSPPATRGSRSFISRLHRHVARGLGLAGQDDIVSFIAGLQALLDGHTHPAGQQLHPTGPAGPHATGV